MADSQADFVQLWRKRLLHVKDEYVTRGIIGTQASTMKMMIEQYRGNQWEHLGSFGNLRPDQLRVANKIFPTANTMQGEIAARNPRVQVIPRPRREEEIQRMLAIAPAWEALLNYDIEEQAMIRPLNAALRDHQFAPFGAVRHGFTPREEYVTESGNRERHLTTYRPVQPDRPWIRRSAPWNTLLDLGCDSFHNDGGGWWVAFRDLILVEDIKANPNMIFRDGVEELAGSESMDWRDMNQTRPRDATMEDPDAKDRVEVFAVYEAKERTWFQLMLDGPDKLLRKRDDWPLPWETRPVNVFAVNEQSDTPFAVPLLEQIGPLQDEKNKLRTMMAEGVKRAREIVVMSREQVSDEAKKQIAMGEVVQAVEVSGDARTALASVKVGGFADGQSFLLYDSATDEDIRETTGQSRMGRAQRINVETAQEAAQVQQGQDVSSGRILDGFTRFTGDVVRLYAQARRRTMEETGPEVVRVVGEIDAEGLARWATVDPRDLQGDYDFEVIPGSTRPRDKDREALQAANDLQIAAAMPQLLNVAFFAKKWVEKRGFDVMRAMNREALVNAAVAGRAQREEDVRRAAGAQEGNGAGRQQAQPLDSATVTALAAASEGRT